MNAASISSKKGLHKIESTISGGRNEAVCVDFDWLRFCGWSSSWRTGLHPNQSHLRRQSAERLTIAGRRKRAKTEPPYHNDDEHAAEHLQQFLQMLQSQLYASLANAVSTAITGTNAQAAGTIKLNNMQVSWSTVNGQKTITLTDYSTGQVTTIVLPVIGS